MSYYRGVSEAESKRLRLEEIAAEMRAKYLFHGRGCGSRRKAISQRIHGTPNSGSDSTIARGPAAPPDGGGGTAAANQKDSK